MNALVTVLREIAEQLKEIAAALKVRKKEREIK